MSKNKALILEDTAANRLFFERYYLKLDLRLLLRQQGRKPPKNSLEKRHSLWQSSIWKSLILPDWK